ncbi:MAG: efflux RND transporter periplasmic adaptor subunit [Micropepsaceae bacterium]
MRASIIWVAAALALAAIGGVAWWSMSGQSEMPSDTTAANTGPILYYRDPSGAPDYSPVLKKDGQGRDYIAVRAPDESAQMKKQVDRPVLYYRNPMGLSDTSPVPKKDSMGMDYIPVYTDEADQPGTVKISLDKVQRLGVRTASVNRQVLNERILLTGTVMTDERGLAVVSLKFPANVVKLYVAVTGEKVRRGQALFEINSPFILKEELDLALALRSREMANESGGVFARTNERSIRTTRERLRLYEVPEQEIDRLIRTQSPTGHISWPAPQDGTVIEKPIVQGMQAEAGMTLYRLADLSKIWVIAEAPETTLVVAKPGATARISLAAYPGKIFEGKISFVYPEVAMTTRTVKVRIELANAEGLLLPGMFASVEVAAPPGDSALTVPDSALIESGSRQVVLVARGEGLFEPRAVTAGRRAKGMVEIAEGLKEGEIVVTSATFLIDSESNLRAALQGFGQEVRK